MHSRNGDLPNDANSDDGGEGFFGAKARPQRSRIAKKVGEKKARSKRIKRTSPIGGLHQRRNKRINW